GDLLPAARRPIAVRGLDDRSDDGPRRPRAEPDDAAGGGAPGRAAGPGQGTGGTLRQLPGIRAGATAGVPAGADPAAGRRGRGRRPVRRRSPQPSGHRRRRAARARLPRRRPLTRRPRPSSPTRAAAAAWSTRTTTAPFRRSRKRWTSTRALSWPAASAAWLT